MSKSAAEVTKKKPRAWRGEKSSRFRCGKRSVMRQRSQRSECGGIRFRSNHQIPNRQISIGSFLFALDGLVCFSC